MVGAEPMSDTFTDITGSTLKVLFRYPDQNQNWVEVPIPSSFLSAQAQQLLLTPLSDQFQTFWAVRKEDRTSEGQNSLRNCKILESCLLNLVASNALTTAP